MSAGKRRKLHHSPSDDEDDDASFASFSDDAADRGSHHDNQRDEEGDLAQASADEVAENAEEDMSDGSHNSESGSEDGVELEDDEDAQPDNATGPNSNGNVGSRIGKGLVGGTTSSPRAQKQTRIAKVLGTVGQAGSSRSNVFQLQVDDLLQQIRPRRTQKEEIAEEALRAIKNVIEKAPTKEPVSVEQAERDLRRTKVAIPFPEPRPPKDAKYKLGFSKPTHINVVGSYALKTSLRTSGQVDIDMSVTMPSELFQEKDYLNHRYFYKRAYYVGCLAASLKDTQLPYNLRFEDFHSNSLTPVLVVTPLATAAVDQNSNSEWRINVIPCSRADVFPSDKLAPSKNCVRPTGDKAAEPTPFYNSTLRADMLTTPYLKLLHQTADNCAGFRDACLLGNTWLRQRGFTTTKALGSFGNFEWMVTMALLLQGGGPNGKPVLSERYTSYQLFKATLQVLSMRDLNAGLVVGNSGAKESHDGSPRLWDAVREHNILFRMASWTSARLRQEAKTTLAMLNDQLYDGFDATFIFRTDNPALSYDLTIKVPLRTLTFRQSGPSDAPLETCRRLYDVLQRGLGDRLRQISIVLACHICWELGSSRPRVVRDAAVQIGLHINADTVNRTVDRGPPAEEKAQAAAFREFWGDKAELRRFRDGSIEESLVWEDTGTKDKRVIEQVVQHLLTRHFSEKAGLEAIVAGDGFAQHLKGGSGIEPFQSLTKAFQTLETDIRRLDSLPLSIRQIMPASPQLRYSSLQLPIRSGDGRPKMPADVTIQFEGSARWPDDLAAIQRTKIAFLLKLAESLQEANDGVTARAGLENQDNDILNQAYLDITYDTGAAFRMRIHHDREQTLLDRQLKDKASAPSSKETAAAGLAAYKRLYLKSPAHTQAIARLCSRHQALSGTIRLLKKWFASHLLANHIPDEVIELLAARTFVVPWPWQTPSSVQTGFLRTLHWLARWDWRMNPLIVDLSGSGELKPAEVQTIKTRFEAWRKLDPGLNRVVLFAASNVDTDGTTWTDGRPLKVVAGRMTALAKAASAEVAERGLQLEPSELFVSPLDDYDFVLHLNPRLVGGARQQVTREPAYKNLELAVTEDESLVGYDPAELFLADLESVYGSAVLFFSGGVERPIIAGLWSPQTAPRNWKVNLAYSTKPVKAPKVEDVQAEINKEAMLAEMARLGGDLVVRVESNR